MNPSHMHHHRPSASLSLKFAGTKKLKEEGGSDMEGEEEEEFENEVETEEEDEFEEEEEVEEIQLKKKRMDLDGRSGSKMSATATAGGGGGGGGGGGLGVAPPLLCRVENCKADLTECKKYHKRHRVCEYHAKAQVALVDGLRQRFCQQCSRFHELPEFDEAKRSCRRRLEGHNARRRKSSMESRSGEGSGHRGSRLAGKKDQCRLVEERGRSQMVFPKNHQNLHIH